LATKKTHQRKEIHSAARRNSGSGKKGTAPGKTASRASARNPASAEGRGAAKRWAQGVERDAASRIERASADADDAVTSEREAGTALPFPIVALGASAGGLEALTQLFEKMPDDTGMAFVVVQHLDPRHRSILAELLAKSTPMPVIEATEGMEVEPDHVYVIPPNKAMEAEGGLLKLKSRARGETGYRTIDTFLFSLAAQQKNRAIGVILSGTASDGTLGLKAIKEEGGITFAQDRESAKFDGMPAAAIAGGAVDFVLPPVQIASELIQIGRHPYVLNRKLPEADDQNQFSEARLDAIFRLVRMASGVDFTYYKHSTIRRRIMRRMMLNHVDMVADYIEFLKHSPVEVTALFNDILINVTEFFRDPEVFEHLSNTVLPQLIGQRSGAAHSGSVPPLRVWVPGCAAGEEAYSIAMCLLECLGATGQHLPVQIFATDISETALEKARTGIYSEASMAGVSAERRRRFFAKLDGGYQVAKTVRDMCMFARQDLGKDPPFSRLDLISCRNVLIYLGSSLQKRIIPAFHYALKPDGYLLLGTSESIGSFAELFELADKQHKIYRKKPGVSHLHCHPETVVPPARTETPQGTMAHGGDTALVEREADRMLLGRYSPPGVLINEAMNIIQFRGQTGRYLEPATGTASLNLMKMVRSELQMALRKVINEAMHRGSSARMEDQRVRINGVSRILTIDVIPVTSVPVSQGRYFLVLFLEGGAPEEAASRPAAKPRDKKARGREQSEVEQLKQELVATRDYLQSVIEEQEAANEELRSANEEAQSTNEELQSINEELETAKEELQSTNEELTTINEELENVNQELTQANNDLKNLLDCVDVAIVMLGADLRIRRFTPPAGALLNLIASDVGRPLADLRPRIEAPELGQWISTVTETLVPLSRVVQDHAGRRYDLRIKPYRTAENKIDGVVLTIVDRGNDGKEES